MHEIVVNLHMHTTYSDGHGSHADIARAALQAGLDAVIVTDHNVFVMGPEGYHHDGERRVLMLIGEEIHNQTRQPQKNHLLVIGAGKELAPLAEDPQRLVDEVRKAGGLSFIAHPVDPAAPAVNEGDISWVDWDVKGLTGLELWNGFSEFKSHLKSKLHAIYYAYNPKRVARGPFPDVLEKWDQLLNDGRRLVAIGGSDAHALPASMGPLHRTLFPYKFHFSAINNHLLIASPLSGEYKEDRRLILDALSQGRSYIGYDLPASTRGFTFKAHGKEKTAWIGEEVSAKNGVTIQIRLPRPAECHLLRNGKIEKMWRKRDLCTHITTQPGVYRVEVYLQYLGRKRSWILSNPIYVIE
jgi:hypothetical protein